MQFSAAGKPGQHGGVAALGARVLLCPLLLLPLFAFVSEFGFLLALAGAGLRRGAGGALAEALAFVQVELLLAFHAEVFAEAALAAGRPALCASVDLQTPHAEVAGGAGVDAHPVLADAVPPDEQEEPVVAGDAAVLLRAQDAARAVLQEPGVHLLLPSVLREHFHGADE